MQLSLALVLSLAVVDPTLAFYASLPARPFGSSRHKQRLFSFQQPELTEFASTLESQSPTWQAQLEELLDPFTRPGRRQILLNELMNANQEIQASVKKAVSDRTIDPLLTPTQRKFQQGTRVVARQLASDILPSLARQAPPPPPDVSKLGTRLFSALQNQVTKNLETLAGDLSDPSRIPLRFSETTRTIVAEAANVLRDTPANLKEPPYTVVATTADYEIRHYGAYTVASTNIAGAEEPLDVDNVSMSGAAFNSLAAYLFGANRQQQSLDMTTPVTTTASGEMRFYLCSKNSDAIFPEPLDDSKNVYETGTVVLQHLPPSRLAVRRFTGFVTANEIQRQKEHLLTALFMDRVELDVAHGASVPHVVFQYNPPYTIPVMRRNEIAVPILETINTERSSSESSVFGDEDPWASLESDV